MDCKLLRVCKTALLAFLWMPSYGFPIQSDTTVPVVVETEAAPFASNEEEADLALIEFLGQWETDDGEWLPPSELADEAFVELLDTMGSLEIEAID